MLTDIPITTDPVVIVYHSVRYCIHPFPSIIYHAYIWLIQGGHFSHYKTKSFQTRDILVESLETKQYYQAREYHKLLLFSDPVLQVARIFQQ